MTTDELLTKLPSHIGRNNLNGFYVPDNKGGGDIGWLYLHNDGKYWCASYGREGNFVCLNPDAEKPPYNNDEMIEGLVEEETKPKFKVGDRVITNKGYVGKFEGWVSDYQVRVFFEESGDNVVIHPKNLKLVEKEIGLNKWTGLKVELELSKTVIGVSNVESLRGERFMSGFVKAIIPPEGYQFVDENGNVINATKIVLEKKRPKYPQSYEECCKVLNYCCNPFSVKTTHKEEQIRKFQFLLLFRDAYWKLADDWKPDWSFNGETKYCIGVSENTIISINSGVAQYVLAFPTPEMRDAFQEREEIRLLIEDCKEFL